MKENFESLKMTGFMSALQLLAGDRKDEYLSKLSRKTLNYDTSNYNRIYRWKERTTKRLKTYLINNELTQSVTKENFDLFMHYLLAIYFQSLENQNAYKSFKSFKNDFPDFICNCLQYYQPINRKGGHLQKRVISRADISLFFSLFLTVNKDIYNETYPLTDKQREEILTVQKYKKISIQEKIYKFMSIFFPKL